MPSNACSLGGDFYASCPPYDSPTLAYSCTNFDTASNSCLGYEWVEVPAAKSCDAGLDIHDPAVGQLLGAVALLFALAFVFNVLYKFILNK